MNDTYKLQINGIHNNKPLNEVPLKYLDWLIGKSGWNLNIQKINLP